MKPLNTSQVFSESGSLLLSYNMVLFWGEVMTAFVFVNVIAVKTDAEQVYPNWHELAR